MATVTINDKLRERIEVFGDRYSRLERKRLDEVFQRSLPHTGDQLYRTLVGEEHLAWVKQAPVGMLDTADKLKFMAIGGNDVGMDLPLDTPVALPAKATMFPGGQIEAGFKCLQVNLNGTFPAWEPYKDPAEALHTKRKKLQEDIRVLHQFVRALLKCASSIGPVLRMWPPMWDMLDDDDRRRQGAKPYGATIPIPTYIGDEDHVRRMTAMVMRIKMQTR